MQRERNEGLAGLISDASTISQGSRAGRLEVPDSSPRANVGKNH